MVRDDVAQYTDNTDKRTNNSNNTMQQEIRYGTFSASPDDYMAPEGDLAAMAGLERKGDALWGELPRDEKFSLNTGATLLCLHTTATCSNYIYYQEGNESLYRLDEEGRVPYDGGIIHTFAGVTIHKVEPVGNTLVVLASDGVHYILWKNGSYRYLGTHLPELDLAFELTDGKVYESSEHKVEWDEGVETDELASNLRMAIMASLNQAVAKATEKKAFCFPFFVRYAFRMYDDSVTMHSAPILVVPTMDAPTVNAQWIEWDTTSTKFYFKSPARFKSNLYGYHLHCRPMDTGQVEQLAQWSDIVTSVDIFVSPQIYTYNQGAKDSEIVIQRNVVAPANEKLASQICDNGNFHLLKQIRLSSEMPQHNPLLQAAGGEVKFDFEPSNENIVVREQMSDDNGTHDELMADKSFAFNGRINLAGVSKKLFDGFNPGCMWYRPLDVSSNRTTATVTIEVDSREITVQSREGVIHYDQTAEDKVLWFFYPHAGAKRAYLTVAGEKVALELMPHPTLNGAYYCSLSEDAVRQTMSMIPAPSTEQERIVEQPNKIYTSEVYNPFYFPTSGINTVGVGEVMGICAAVKALSQGQFGQFPLYAFTTEGVWALQTDNEGGYSAVQPVTRDVCIDADSITQMDDAVLFTTARGIMLISGSTSQCISDVIDGRVGFSLDMMTEKSAALKNRVEGPAVALEMATFERFREGMRMMYDYRHQRVIVYNDTVESGAKVYHYAYVYSLDSHLWSIVANDLVYHINSHPDALAVTNGGKVVNLSEDKAPMGMIPFVLVTRPIHLGAPEIHKTVTAVLQRGVVDKSHVQQVLFGSRDLLHWHVVGSSANGDMRGYRGTGYKWFRLMVMGALEQGECLTGATVQFDTELTNRPR